MWNANKLVRPAELFGKSDCLAGMARFLIGNDPKHGVAVVAFVTLDDRWSSIILYAQTPAHGRVMSCHEFKLVLPPFDRPAAAIQCCAVCQVVTTWFAGNFAIHQPFAALEQLSEQPRDIVIGYKIQCLKANDRVGTLGWSGLFQMRRWVEFHQLFNARLGYCGKAHD